MGPRWPRTLAELSCRRHRDSLDSLRVGRSSGPARPLRRAGWAGVGGAARDRLRGAISPLRDRWAQGLGPGALHGHGLRPDGFRDAPSGHGDDDSVRTPTSTARSPAMMTL